MFISAFNYIRLMGCGPQEIPRCWHVGGLGNCLLFALQTENLSKSFFMEIPFVFLYKVADYVTQQMRN